MFFLEAYCNGTYSVVHSGKMTFFVVVIKENGAEK
jgi:hypothetical protein